MPKHAERRVLPFTPRQLFDLVADVERYPEFLPWCVASRVRRRDGDRIIADLAIGFRMLRERFTTEVTLEERAGTDPRIGMSVVDGPFRHMNGHWIFHPHPDGCEVEFFIDFEFRSFLLQATVEVLFHEAVRRMVNAFEGRARRMYGARATAATQGISAGP